MEKNKILSHKYFSGQTDDIFIQFFRYFFVGGFVTLLDMGVLYVLTEFFNVYYLISAGFAFCVGIAVNYVVSISWVFKSKGEYGKEISVFALIGVGGLFMNQFIMWFFVSLVGFYYMYAKLISTAIVLFWNFGMRRKMFN